MSRTSILMLSLMGLFLLIHLSQGRTHLPRLRRYVYALVQSPSGNQIVTYIRERKSGFLTQVASSPTGGNGVVTPINDPLGSQDSLILSPNLKFIVVVNSASNTISVLLRNFDGSLSLTSTVSSFPGVNSTKPTSLGVKGNYLYVLNSGLQSSIQGYVANWNTGVLTPITGSSRTFPGNYGQVGFSPFTNQLILPGKAGNNFLVFNLDKNNAPTTPTGINSPIGNVFPFSFVWDITRQYLLVAQAGIGGAASYSVSSAGVVTLVHQINTSSLASCWIVRNPASRNFYVVNAGQPSISGFTLGVNGAFTQINGNLFTSATTSTQDLALLGVGSTPIDATISSNNKFLDVILAGRGTVATYAINSDGTLLPRGEVPLLQPGHNGLNGIVSG